MNIPIDTNHKKYPQNNVSIALAEAPSNATSVTQWNRKLFHNYPTLKAFQAYDEEVCRLDKRGRRCCDNFSFQTVFRKKDAIAFLFNVNYVK